MKAMVMIQHPQERMLVTQGLQASGVSVQQASNVTSLEPGWGMESIDVVILAAAPEQVQEAVRQIRMVSAAPLIVIADLIEEKERMALYVGGADMVFARPYSLRFLLMQAGTIAYRVGGTHWPQPSTAPMNPLTTKTLLAS